MVIGPNTRPTFSVPKRWVANSTTSTASAIGSTQWPSSGAATSRPSTAASTDTAGVSTPSPKNSDAPRMPTMPTT